MNVVPDYCKCRVLVLGCGNVLFGDDGFGPAVVEYLQKNYKIPDDVCVIDAGCGVREILFVVSLSDVKPQKIIVVDTVNTKRIPGEIFEIDIDDIPKNKVADFSMHQTPTSNLLKNIQDSSKIKIVVLVAQIKNISSEMSLEISHTLVSSIPKMCDAIMEEIGKLE